MRILGYRGRACGFGDCACFAKLGHIICADNDIEKIERIKNLDMPFYEIGLETW